MFGNSRQQYIIVFSFVAIFLSQERFLLWNMTREHLTDCERKMSYNMSQVGNTGKYFHPSCFLNLHSIYIHSRYSNLSSRRFLFSNVKHEIKCIEHSLTWEQWKYIVSVKQEALSFNITRLDQYQTLFRDMGW